jgi:hypothetical protein
MLIGYARVSTDDQNLDLQRDALRQAGCEKIYEDRISGAKAGRPGLAMALEVAHTGDRRHPWSGGPHPTVPPGKLSNGAISVTADHQRPHSVALRPAFDEI